MTGIFKWNFRMYWARFTPCLFRGFLASTLKVTKITGLPKIYHNFRFFLKYVVKNFRVIKFFGWELFLIWSIEWWLHTGMPRRSISCKFYIFFQKLKKSIFFHFFKKKISSFFMKNFKMEICLWSWKTFFMIHRVQATCWYR